MKSVGEAMSLGRSFPEALNKAMRSMETSQAGFWTRPDPAGATRGVHPGRAGRPARRPTVHSGAGAAARGQPWPRCATPAAGSTRGSSTRSPSWSSCAPRCSAAPVLDEPLLRRAKRAGLSDAQLAALRPELAGEDGVRALRHRLGLRPVYKTVDTCAAEFGAPDAVPLLLLRRGDRGRTVGPAQGADPRLRAEPDRAGHRVRLLVRARGDGAARRPASRPSW